MHTEADIRRAIVPLLDQYGALSTTEVKQHLSEVLVFDEEDKLPSPTRNEIRIIQRIGNIVAHQISSFQTYEEGFAVDKSVRPARFIALRGLGDGKAVLTREDIQARRQRTRAFIARRVDWEAVQREKTELGRLGEEFVVAFERTRVAALDPSSVDRVLHLSRLQGDGLGYDISSVNPDGSIRRIEVKTTRGGIRTPFYMSRNERLFLETYQDDGAFVYRVYEFDADHNTGRIQMIPAAALLEQYAFEPTEFQVSLR